MGSNSRLKGAFLGQQQVQSTSTQKTRNRPVEQGQDQIMQQLSLQNNEIEEDNLNDSFQRLVEYKINELVEENARLLELVSDKQTEIELLKKQQRMQFQDIMEKVNATETFISTSQNEIQFLKDERDSLTKKIETSENALLEERQRAATYLMNFETIDRQVQQVITENAYLNTEIEQKQILLDQQTSNLEKATLLINQLNSALEMQTESVYQHNSDTQRGQVDDHSKSSRSLDHQKDNQNNVESNEMNQEEEIQFMQVSPNQNDRNIQQLMEGRYIEQDVLEEIEKNNLEYEIETLKSENIQLKIDNGQHEQKIRSLEIQVQSLQQEQSFNSELPSEIKSQHKSQDYLINSQKSQINEKEILNLKNQIISLSNKLKIEQLKALEKGIPRSNNKLLEEMRRGVAELDQKNNEFREKLDQSNKLIQELKYSLEEEKKEKYNLKKIILLKDQGLAEKDSLLMGQIVSFNQLQQSLNFLAEQTTI